MASPPNVLLIVADDLGYNDLGSFGSPTLRTPAIDRLAREGMRFTQFYVSAGICTPSRASLLTGRLAVRSGTYTALAPPNDEYFRVFYPSSEGCMDPREVTVAASLRGSGLYGAAALVGKWHLGHRVDLGCLPGDGRRGFDDFFGLPYSHEEGYPGPFPEGVVWPPVPLYRNATIVEQPFNVTDLTTRYTAEAVAFVQAQAAAQPDRPWFLHVAYEAPHVPLFAGPEFQGTSRRGPYGDAVEEMDASVGTIMAAVRGNPALAASTLVFFLSDNGAWINANSGLSSPRVNARSGIGPYDGGSNGALRDGKGSTYEGGVRVPCVAWWPSVVPAGRTSMATVSSLDVMPTVLSLAGVPLPAGVAIDGKDQTAVLTGAGDDFGPWYGDFLFFWRESQVYAARHKRFKLHYITRSGFNISDLGTFHDPPLVFDVEQDCAEAKPVDTDPATRTAEVDALLAASAQALQAHLDAIGPLPPPQYGAQNWTVVPCCPRASFDPAEAAAYARAGAWGMAVWDECVCTLDE